MHLLRELLLPFELPLPELDTLSDLLIDFLVGSNSRSNIWRIVLCLRLNGLVYILFSSRPLSFEMEFFLDLCSRSKLYSKENVLLIAFETLYHFFFYSNFDYVSQRDMLIECSKLCIDLTSLEWSLSVTCWLYICTTFVILRSSSGEIDLRLCSS